MQQPPPDRRDTYAVIDQIFDWADRAADIIERLVNSAVTYQQRGR